MHIFIGADHRGFDLKNKIIEYLQEKNIRVEDMGAYDYNANDDYPDYAQKVARGILQHPEESLGILICGSGVGVSVAANRFTGIICALGFDENQIAHFRANDHANVLALPSDYIDFDTAKKFIDIFLRTQPRTEERYLQRLKKLNMSTEGLKL